MITKIIDLKEFALLSDKEIEDILKPAIDDIKNSNVVAFPTETVYGLGANALNKDAVEKIFIIKGRPKDNPLIVHIGSINDINELIDLDKIDEKITKISKNIIRDRIEKAIKYLPGPISLILPANTKIIPEITRGKLPTVAIRFPDHKIANILIKGSGLPIAAPSANISGKPSCTKAEDVKNDFEGRIKYIIDGGNSVYGIESTVVDLTSEKPYILRPGFITKEDLIEDFNDIEYTQKLNFQNSPKSPGMKYTHYKPEAKVIIIIKECELDFLDNLFGLKNLFCNKIKRLSDINISFILKENFLFINSFNSINNILKNNDLSNVINKNAYSNNQKNKTEKINFENPYNLAKNIYSIFREADKKNLKYIIIKPFIKSSGIEFAILNRLIKAAEEIWII